jgi:hypothetical protein
MRLDRGSREFEGVRVGFANEAVRRLAVYACGLFQSRRFLPGSKLIAVRRPEDFWPPQPFGAK